MGEWRQALWRVQRAWLSSIDSQGYPSVSPRAIQFAIGEFVRGDDENYAA